MLAQRLVDVGGWHVQSAHLPSQSGEALDEAVRRGGPLELELVDRCPEAYRATRWS